MGVSLQFQTVMLTNFANQKPENNARLKSKPKIASFLWVEIGLSVYWPVSCGGNEFLGKILNLSSYISNKFSVFMLKLVHE